MGWPEHDIAQAAGFIAPPGYQRHRPEATLLYRLVAEHYPAFRDRRAAAAPSGDGVASLALDGRDRGVARGKCPAAPAGPPVGAVAAVRTAVSARDPARGRHAGARHRLSGDLRVSDSQGRPETGEQRHRGRDADPALRQNPRRIVLFGESEKAHADIFNVFLQILDDARLTDNRGLTVSFHDAIILMTTNIGTVHFLNENDFDVARKLALEDLDERYRPEFLARFNGKRNIVCFNTLPLPFIETLQPATANAG